MYSTEDCLVVMSVMNVLQDFDSKFSSILRFEFYLNGFDCVDCKILYCSVGYGLI